MPCPPPGVFPTQRPNSPLLHCRRIPYQLSHQGNPRVLEWAAYPTLCNPMDCSPPGSSLHVDSPGKNIGVGCHDHPTGDVPNPGIELGSPALQAGSLPAELPGKPWFSSALNNTGSYLHLITWKHGGSGRKSSCQRWSCDSHSGLLTLKPTLSPTPLRVSVAQANPEAGSP